MCHWCSCHILTSSVIYYLIRRTETWNLFVLYNNEKPFFPKYFNITRKPAFCPAFALKKPFDVIFDRFKMKQFHWLLCVAKNRDWSRKIAPLSIAPRWMTTYSESRIELRNLQIFKKILENRVSFCHRSSPLSRKAWTLPWKLQELKKYLRKTCGYGQPRSHLIPVLNETSVNDGGDFCLLWLVILKSAWYSVETHFSCDTADCG